MVMKEACWLQAGLAAVGIGGSEYQSDRLSRVMSLDGWELFFNPKRVGEIKVSNED